ncbi:MAG: BT_3987 domain-containing protein [Bacteroidales bacterium]
MKLNQIVICALLVVFALSCKDDDFGNIEETKIYIPAIGPTYNSLSGNVVVLRNEKLAGNGLKFPILSTRPVPKDVEIEVAIDTSMISVYDTINETHSQRYPDGLFSLSSNIVSISAGETSSRDSISLSLNASINIPDSIESVIVPIVISTPNSPVPTSATRNVMYLNVSFTEVGAVVGKTKTVNVSTSTVDYTPINVKGPDKLVFYGFLSQAIPKSVNITVSVADNSAVDIYNEEHGTSHKYFPKGAYVLSKDMVTIPVDATESEENFEVAISDLNAFKKDNSYLLALSIKDEGVVKPSRDANTMYLVVNTGFSNIDKSKTSAPASTFDRKGWSIKDVGSERFGKAIDVLDDNYKTAWFTPVGDAYVSIDMGKEQALSGVQVSPSYKYGISNNNAKFEIETSVDNVKWSTQGIYSGDKFGGSTTTPDLRNVHFYAPVEARYFRITFKRVTSYYAGASEIRGF